MVWASASLFSYFLACAPAGVGAGVCRPSTSLPAPLLGALADRGVLSPPQGSFGCFLLAGPSLWRLRARGLSARGRLGWGLGSPDGWPRPIALT